jgi:hypothetical protein
MRWVTLPLVLATATAHADPPSQKSRALALAVPIGFTFAGFGLVTLGGSNQVLEGTGGALIAVGPSLGHLYVHDWFSFGLGVRIAGAAVFAEPYVRGEHGDQMSWWIAGAAIYAVGALWEIGTAPGKVYDYNRAHAVSLVPTRGGLAIAGAF